VSGIEHLLELYTFFCFFRRRAASFNNLFKSFTMQEVLDEHDINECFEVQGQQLQVGETTKRQIDLYSKLGVAPPTLLQ
jgi:hypothetical protein